MRVRRPRRYRYAQSGLPGVFLTGGVTIEQCAVCDAGFLQIAREQQLLQVLAVALLSKPLGLTGAEMKYLRKECGLTQAELADRLGLGRRETVAERETGKVTVTREAEFWFRAVILEEFVGHLARPGNCFLADAHRKQLRALEEAFVELPHRKAGGGGTVSLTLAPTGWRLPDAA